MCAFAINLELEGAIIHQSSTLSESVNWSGDIKGEKVLTVRENFPLWHYTEKWTNYRQASSVIHVLLMNNSIDSEDVDLYKTCHYLRPAH